MEAPIEEPTIETPPKEELEFEEKLRRAKAYAEEDPRRAAKIIKNWLKEDGRPEHSSV